MRLLLNEVNSSNERYCFLLRIDLKEWERMGVSLITWTVNDEYEKAYFEKVLQLPYMTDLCKPATQNNHYKSKHTAFLWHVHQYQLGANSVLILSLIIHFHDHQVYHPVIVALRWGAP